MPNARVTLVNPLGLHARAAAKIVKLAGEFESEITIVRTSRARSADARSILAILELGAKSGSELSIETQGIDEDDALTSLVALIGRGFDEI
jgi:phosphocarrier protein